MTREEAVAKLDAGRVVQYPGDFVDGLVALGLLNLEKPKSHSEIIGARLRQLGDLRAYDCDGLGAYAIEALEEYGLTIVEKQHGE